MNSNYLPHVAAQVWNTPLLIEQGKLDTILAALGPRLGSDAAPFDHAKATAEAARRTAMLANLVATDEVAVTYEEAGYYLAGDVAIVPVMGTLVHRGGWLSAMSGLQGYDHTKRMAMAALSDRRVKRVVYEFDTPGGAAAGAFDFADWLYDQRGVKPTISMVNELAASAGYLCAAAAGGEIVVPRTGLTGSIGVVVAHIDRSKQLAEAGVAVTYVYAGSHKVDGNSTEPLKPAVKKDIQVKVNATYELFVSSVARYRGLSEAAVRDTQAAVLGADDAKAIGLVDRIASFDSELSSQIFSRTGARSSRLATHSQETHMSEATQPTSAPAAHTAEQMEAARIAASAEGTKAGATAERERVKAILALPEAKKRTTLAAHFATATDMTVEAAQAALAVAPEEKTAGNLGPAMDAGGTPNVQNTPAPQTTSADPWAEVVAEVRAQHSK